MPVEVERENSLTCHNMGREVELRNEAMKRFAIAISMHPVGVLLHPLPEVDAPLTSDII
jgi:hypothetical protein